MPTVRPARCDEADRADRAAVVLVGAVGEIEPRDVHAGAGHPREDRWVWPARRWR